MVNNSTERFTAVEPGQRTVVVIVRQPGETTDALAERVAARLKKVFTRSCAETHVWITAGEGHPSEDTWLQHLVAAIVGDVDRWKGSIDPGGAQSGDFLSELMRAPVGSARAVKIDLGPRLAKTRGHRAARAAP